MAKFKSTIADPKGKISTKIISAAGRAVAQRLLEKDGSTIIALKEINDKKHWWEWSSPLRQKDILMITKRVGDMTGSGFSIVDALKTIELQTQHPTLKEVIQDLKGQVEMGNSFSDALSGYPRYFSNVFVSMVRVGEESGTLPRVLGYLQKQEEEMYKLKKKAVSAMIYPGVIMSLMVVIGVGMVVFLIPFLRDIFSSFTAELPLPTRILMASEEYLRRFWWVMLGAALALFVFVKLVFKSEKVVVVWDRILLGVPFLKTMIMSFNSARIIRTFATLNKTGVPMSQSLAILATVPNNKVYSLALDQIKRDVDKGNIFSMAVEKHPTLFSPLVIESIKLGEDAGNLGDSMGYLAEIFEEDYRNNLETLSSFIQPLLLILVGVMVAGFALSVIVPLQRLPSLIQHK